MAKTIFQTTSGNAPSLTDLSYTGQDPSGSPALRQVTWATIRNLFVGTPSAIGDMIVSIDGSTWVKRTLEQAKTILGVPGLDGWNACIGTHSYASATTVTVPSGAALIYCIGDRYKYIQDCKQAYTNDPAAGSNITLKMTDTSKAHVGNIVTVSSSAGSEKARITTVTANTSIVVDALALNHTTTSPMVYFSDDIYGTKYAYIVGIADTTLTLCSGNDWQVENVTISTPYYSRGRAVGFKEYFAWIPTLNNGSAVLSGYTKARFKIDGYKLSFDFNADNKSLSGSAGVIGVGLPLAVGANSVNTHAELSQCYIPPAYVFTRVATSAAATYMSIYKDMTATNWNANETDLYFFIKGSYEIGNAF